MQTLNKLRYLLKRMHCLAAVGMLFVASSVSAADWVYFGVVSGVESNHSLATTDDDALQLWGLHFISITDIETFIIDRQVRCRQVYTTEEKSAFDCEVSVGRYSQLSSREPGGIGGWTSKSPVGSDGWISIFDVFPELGWAERMCSEADQLSTSNLLIDGVGYFCIPGGRSAIGRSSIREFFN